MGRLTDNDKHFGPITYGRSSFDAIRLVWSSEGDDEGCHDPKAWNSLTGYAFGWVAKINMPRIIKPHQIQHKSTLHDSKREFWYETFPKEYGFSLSDGFLQVFLGPQTHDSLTTKSWSKFLPWTQWRFYRFSLYDTTGAEFWTQIDRPRKKGTGVGDKYEQQHKQEQLCPKVSFKFKDFDGQELSVTTCIQEREWHFGEGWFKWLSWFRKPKVVRSLDLQFSDEVGPEKGSWKGGTMGHGIDMLSGELHEAAFRRYCGQEHRSKSGKYRIAFIGAAV